MSIFGPPDINKMETRRDVKGLLKALTYWDNNIRRDAVRALGRLGDSSAMDGLIGALQNDDNVTRQEAAKALGGLGDPSAVDGLIGALQDDDSMTRQEAAWALGRIGEPRAIEPLTSAFQDHAYIVGNTAVAALAKIKDTRIVEVLLDVLRNSNGPIIEAAGKALGEIRSLSTIQPLTQIAVYDSLPYRQKAAEDALSPLGGADGEILIKALKANSEIVRKRAVMLMTVGDVRFLEPLLEALRDPNKGVRQSAATALGRMKAPIAITPLTITYLYDDVMEVSKAAYQAIKEIGTPDRETLFQGLEDGRENIRLRAAISLDMMSESRVIDVLTNAIKNGIYIYNEIHIFTRLEKLGWQPGNDEIAGVYWAAKGNWEKCISLGRQAVPGVIRVLCETKTHASKDAVATLGKLQGPGVVETLIDVLKNGKERPDVELEAVRALGESKDIRAVEPLIAELGGVYLGDEAALALSKLYKSDAIGEIGKKMILDRRHEITNRRHTDYPAHNDDRGCHEEHTDSGIDGLFLL